MSDDTLTKRPYDQRLFSVDVSGKLRIGDEVTSFVSIASSGKEDDTTGVLTVSIGTPAIDGKDRTVINFNASGGDSEQSYLVSLRYTSTTEAALESVVQVDVV